MSLVGILPNTARPGADQRGNVFSQPSADSAGTEISLV